MLQIHCILNIGTNMILLGSAHLERFSTAESGINMGISTAKSGINIENYSRPGMKVPIIIRNPIFFAFRSETCDFMPNVQYMDKMLKNVMDQHFFLFFLITHFHPGHWLMSIGAMDKCSNHGMNQIDRINSIHMLV